MEKKHFFQVCRKHRRANVHGLWMNDDQFIKFIRAYGITADQIKISEIQCDKCVKE